MKNVLGFLSNYRVALGFAICSIICTMMLVYAIWVGGLLGNVYIVIGPVIILLCVGIVYDNLVNEHGWQEASYENVRMMDRWCGFAGFIISFGLCCASWVLASGLSFSLALSSSVFAFLSLILFDGKLQALKSQSFEYNTHGSQMAVLAGAAAFGYGAFSMSSYLFYFHREIHGNLVILGVMILLGGLLITFGISVHPKQKRETVNVSAEHESEEGKPDYEIQHELEAKKAQESRIKAEAKPTTRQRLTGMVKQPLIRMGMRKTGMVEVPVVKALVVRKVSSELELSDKDGVVQIENDWVDRLEDYTCVRVSESLCSSKLSAGSIIGINHANTEPILLVNKLVLAQIEDVLVSGIVKQFDGLFYLELPDGNTRTVKPGQIIGTIDWRLNDAGS